MSKPTSPCIFCGAIGDLSKEHLWSQWLRKHTAANGSTLTTTEFGFTYGPNATAIIHPTESRTQRKTPLNLQVREVCRDCNNGWMSCLDEQVKPDLLTLMQGQELVLTPDRAAAIATWATMKAFTNEFLGRPGKDSTPLVFSTPAMRRHVLEHGEPPPNTLVWAGTHQGTFHLDIRAAQIPIGETPDLSSPEVKTQLTALTVGALTLLVWTADLRRAWATPPRYNSTVWAPFWPATEAVRWPRPRTVSDLDVHHAVAYHGNHLRTPPVQRIRRDDIAAELRGRGES